MSVNDPTPAIRCDRGAIAPKFGRAREISNDEEGIGRLIYGEVALAALAVLPVPTFWSGCG